MAKNFVPPENRVPEPVVETILACYGEQGRQWLISLPEAITRLADRWKLRLGAPFEGGSVAYVAPVMRLDGTEAVLKVSFVDDETRHEGDALAAWAGHGAVLLLDQAPEEGALLLERIHPGTALSKYADRDGSVEIACGLLRKLAIPVAPVHPFQLATDLAAEWRDHLAQQYMTAGRPFPESFVERAVRLCQELSEWRQQSFLVNRDFHLDNVLAAEREPWLLIDPKPLAGEASFSTGHLLRSLLSSDFRRGDIDHLVQQLSTGLALPSRRIALWTYVRSVENAIWSAETKLGDVDRDIRCAEFLEHWL